ncbi:MAG: FeoA domain-containing protein [Coriobacteriales bacterium]|nr:FeoA domain-containing protein [Coriobacteriales bacterium]
MSAGLPLVRTVSGQTCRVLSYQAEPRTRSKLEVLGLVTNSVFTVLSNTRTGLILKVKESRLAIGFDLAKQIMVEVIETPTDRFSGANSDLDEKAAN